MKSEAKGLVVEIEDDDFLSQVAAAEAQALANKRRRVSIPSSQNAAVALNPLKNPKDGSDGGDGGLYTAALKGSQIAAPQPPRGGLSRGGVDSGAAGNADAQSGGDSCFKCGKSGHWARDCGVPGGGGGGGGCYGGAGGGDSSVPEKSCPCGSGGCLVLTANTEKNRGRKFYKCPLRQENRGCGFFEWCDNASCGPIAMATTATGSLSCPRTNSYAPGSSFPALECPCGGGMCLVLTAKTGKNIGSQFYRCPANEGTSCGFFKWCNEQTTAPTGVPGRGGSVQYGLTEANNSGYGVRTGSSCYKCEKEGHWSRDCPEVSSYNAPVEFGGRSASASMGTCYKCQKEGHWARDCPAVPSYNVAPVELGGFSASASKVTSASKGTCYKCGKPGHWSRDCPSG